MEQSRFFYIVVITLGVLALLFQAIGYFAPAWISFDIKINTDGTKMEIGVDMGLWATTACVDGPEFDGEQCQAVSNDEIRRSITSISGATGEGQEGGETAKVAGLNFQDDFTKVKVLAGLGGILSVVGMAFLFLFLFSRASCTKNTGIISALSWGLGAILVFAAVGLQAHQNINFDHGIDIFNTMPKVSKMIKMKNNFPWAILMSGLGATFNILVAGIVTFKACYINDPNAPGMWNRFSNQSV